MKRKTIDMKFLVEYGNAQLSRTDEWATKDFKSGVCCMIEKVLHETNNYKGFMFNNNNDSEINTKGYYSRRYFV